MTTQKTNVGQLAGDAALGFLGSIIAAKKEGQELPKALDAVATIAIQGENKAIEIVKEEAKEQTMKRLSWIIVAILTTIIIVMVVKNKA